MRQAADGVAASLATAAPAEDRQRAAILQARGRRRTPPGKIVADGRLQPEPRGIAAPMTRFTVKQGRGVAPYRQEHDAFGNAIRRRTNELDCRSKWKVRRTRVLDCRRICATVSDRLMVAASTTCKMPIHVTTSISPSLNCANPRRRSAAKTSKAERRAKVAARQFARQSTASMPLTGRLFAPLRKKKRGPKPPRLDKAHLGERGYL